jgi:MFS family permease
MLFVAMAASSAAMLLMSVFIRDQSTPQPVDQAGMPDVVPAGERANLGRPLKWLLGANLSTRFAILAGGLCIPLVMTQQGFDATAVASATAISGAIALPLPLILGWLSDKAGRKRYLVICYGICVCGLLLLIPAFRLWQFWLAASLLAMTEAAGGVAQAYAADLTPAQAMGRGMSLYNTTNLFAGIVGVGAAGYIIQAIGINPMLLLTAALPLAAIALLLRVRKPAPTPELLTMLPMET